MPEDKPPHAREVDAATLKAFAHPLRMQMYDWLKEHGSGTASMLAEALGESTGQTSYHLRQLERHGLVAEDTTRGTARERWWVAQGFSFGLSTLEGDPTSARAFDLVLRKNLERRAGQELGWIERVAEEDRSWHEAALFSEATTRMTTAELGELGQALLRVLDDHVAQARARRRTDGDDGTRMVKVQVQTFPLAPEG